MNMYRVYHSTIGVRQETRKFMLVPADTPEEARSLFEKIFREKSKMRWGYVPKRIPNYIGDVILHDPNEIDGCEFP